jgi:hypothetical protein
VSVLFIKVVFIPSLGKRSILLDVNQMIFLIESRIMLSAIATFRTVGLQPSLGNLAILKKPASPDGFAG